ncbi:MAG: nucleotidyltransferase domain-containing protein [Gemmatimonadetes bacterium]|nr:nucleotidyltransferase domain-containing protein [Gemmatimonadota bacterium]
MVRAAKSTDPLSLALASGAMARVVRYFAVNPEARPHVRALQRATGLGPRSMQREIDRLSRLELLVREDDGPLVRWRVDENNPAWDHFRQLVRRLSDPADVLPYALTGLPRIDAAFIFGSHARDRARPDSDVDLFVLHRGVSESDLLRQTLEAGVLMNREVTVVTATTEELQRRLNEENRYFLDVIAGPKQWVAGSSKVLADLTDLGEDE